MLRRKTGDRTRRKKHAEFAFVGNTFYRFLGSHTTCERGGEAQLLELQDALHEAVTKRM
jgi:hypothetical protein